MSSFPPQGGLTIGAVAARTGLTVAALRAWEQRHGFPTPARLDGGHRRYDEADVARIRRVLEERAAGRSLAVAIALARQSPEEPSVDVTLEATLNGGLRRHRPDLPVHLLSRRSMLALSYAIEDESLARADRPHLLGAFQRVEAYRLAHRRWESLIGQSASATVLADFRATRRRPGWLEVRVPQHTPLAREWFVVCDAPGSAAVLSGWERPDGRFEALWSVEPAVVRLATRIGRRLVEQLAPRLTLPDGPYADAEPDQAVQRATALTNRIVAYLDRLPV